MSAHSCIVCYSQRSPRFCTVFRSVPGEKDIFGNSSMLLHSNAPEIPVPAAFSEASLKNLRRDNLIDIEGHHILRKLAQSQDRVQVYDRSQPTLLVRSAALSTSVTLPALDSMRRTEISFGSQKVRSVLCCHVCCVCCQLVVGAGGLSVYDALNQRFPIRAKLRITLLYRTVRSLFPSDT
jgi:hypothetical protein